MSQTQVIYNASCPICSREVDGYRRQAERAERPVSFHDINSDAAVRYGLTPDEAARRFHVVENGQIVSGVDAFVLLWRQLPRMRWLARLVALPGIRHAAAAGYDWIAAPALYALHRRRIARAACKG